MSKVSLIAHAATRTLRLGPYDQSLAIEMRLRLARNLSLENTRLSSRSDFRLEILRNTAFRMKESAALELALDGLKTSDSTGGAKA